MAQSKFRPSIPLPLCRQLRIRSWPKSRKRCRRSSNASSRDSELGDDPVQRTRAKRLREPQCSEACGSQNSSFRPTLTYLSATRALCRTLGPHSVMRPAYACDGLSLGP